jgi:hypothetical protein
MQEHCVHKCLVSMRPINITPWVRNEWNDGMGTETTRLFVASEGLGWLCISSGHLKREGACGPGERLAVDVEAQYSDLQQWRVLQLDSGPGAGSDAGSDAGSGAGSGAGSDITLIKQFSLNAQLGSEQLFVQSMAFLGTMSTEVIVVGSLYSEDTYIARLEERDAQMSYIYSGAESDSDSDYDLGPLPLLAWKDCQIPYVGVVDVATGLVRDHYSFEMDDDGEFVKVTTGRTGRVAAVISNDLSEANGFSYMLRILHLQPDGHTWVVKNHGTAFAVRRVPSTGCIQFCEQDRLLAVWRGRAPFCLSLLDVATGECVKVIKTPPIPMVSGAAYLDCMYGRYLSVVSLRNAEVLQCWDVYGNSHGFAKTNTHVASEEDVFGVGPLVVLPAGGGFAAIVMQHKVETCAVVVRHGDRTMVQHVPRRGLQYVLTPMWINPVTGNRRAWMTAVIRGGWFRANNVILARNLTRSKTLGGSGRLKKVART